MLLTQHPSTISMPLYPLPGIVTGERPRDRWEWIKLVTYVLFKNVPAGAKSLRVKAEVSNAHFARFLAKIAHSWATACLGTNAFHALLPDILLGRNDNAPYLIGSHSQLPLPVKSNLMLWVGDRPFGNKRYVVCEIRLFPRIGLEVSGSRSTPVYYVVVGEIDPAIHFQKPLQTLPSGISREALSFFYSAQS